MEESHVIKLIRQVIRQELGSIMMASITANKDQFRSSVKRFGNDSPISNLRNISNYGFASRAPTNTDAMVVPVNNDVTHLNVIGHFDPSRPAINDGEAILYGADGQVVYMKAGGTIHQGTQTAASPVVLGDVLKTLLENVLEAFINNESSVAFDGLGLPCVLLPTITTALTQEKSNHLDDASQNILAQKNFVDRGA